MSPRGLDLGVVASRPRLVTWLLDDLIAGAFVDNLVGRAAASDRRLTSEEQARVRAWFGG
ncbi:hypothetical protein [Nocardioides sp. AX2bis]|uniref:hypothetical protein n=1 Tax=Nocardioides sp. AX2bis TaxID=2653157 RepID=UPI0012F11D1E|nr:hypothetical protein [Nocardioides sp. AX2bis]VXC10021.1 hypothetical protein NOCARDAX2BIS_420038 [Nocardioides sp. AX2bis]